MISSENEKRKNIIPNCGVEGWVGVGVQSYSSFASCLLILNQTLFYSLNLVVLVDLSRSIGKVHVLPTWYLSDVFSVRKISKFQKLSLSGGGGSEFLRHRGGALQGGGGKFLDFGRGGGGDRPQ